MHINEALYSYLSTALSNNRIYPDNLPQNPVLPAITYKCIATLRHHEFEKDSKLIDSTIQFTVWGTSRKAAKTLSTQLRKVLQDYSGMMSSVRVSAVLLLDESDDYDNETGQYRTDIDYKIIHDEE